MHETVGVEGVESFSSDFVEGATDLDGWRRRGRSRLVELAVGFEERSKEQIESRRSKRLAGREKRRKEETRRKEGREGQTRVVEKRCDRRLSKGKR